MSDFVMEFRETDKKIPTGRSVTFEDLELVPLQYDDLKGQKLGVAVTVALQWRGARIVESDIPEAKIGSIVSVNATLESPFTLKAIGLVKGGWLPPALGAQASMILLPDRCTISELRSRFRNGERTKLGNPDFIDAVFDREIVINPMLFAIEGNQRRIPTEAEVAAQLSEATLILQAALPRSKVTQHGSEGLSGLVGLVKESQAGIENKQALLVELAPALAAPTSAARTRHLCDVVLECANKHDIQLGSLVVIALLSVVLVPNGKSPAKRMLNIKPDYDDRDAYNALSDLRALELFMCLLAMYPDQRMMLCTGDKDLALFWVAIRASAFHVHSRVFNYRLTPIEALLPGIPDEYLTRIFGGIQSNEDGH